MVTYGFHLPQFHAVSDLKFEKLEESFWAYDVNWGINRIYRTLLLPKGILSRQKLVWHAAKSIFRLAPGAQGSKLDHKSTPNKRSGQQVIEGCLGPRRVGDLQCGCHPREMHLNFRWMRGWIDVLVD